MSWYRLLPVTVGMGIVFYLSHQPGDSFSLPDIVNIDKLLHLLVYAALGLAFLFALSPGWRQRRPLLAGGAVVLFCLGYGITDELHQSFVAHRFASVTDVLADGAGGMMAATIAWCWRRRRGPGRSLCRCRR